jgi:hypothetical protein
LHADDVPTAAQDAHAGDSSDLNFIDQSAITPDAVSKWTADMDEEVKKSKLAAVIVAGTMPVSLLEFYQLFVNNGAPNSLIKSVIHFVPCFFLFVYVATLIIFFINIWVIIFLCWPIGEI